MKITHKLKCYLYLALLQTSFSVLADCIQPDRPGFSTGTYTVEPKMIHIEMGFESSYANNRDDPNTIAAPLLNVRAGLTPKTELNFLMGGWY